MRIYFRLIYFSQINHSRKYKLIFHGHSLPFQKKNKNLVDRLIARNRLIVLLSTSIVGGLAFPLALICMNCNTSVSDQKCQREIDFIRVIWN